MDLASYVNVRRFTAAPRLIEHRFQVANQGWFDFVAMQCSGPGLDAARAQRSATADVRDPTPAPGSSTRTSRIHR